MAEVGISVLKEGSKTNMKKVVKCKTQLYVSQSLNIKEVPKDVKLCSQSVKCSMVLIYNSNLS